MNNCSYSCFLMVFIAVSFCYVGYCMMIVFFILFYIQSLHNFSYLMLTFLLAVFFDAVGELPSLGLLESSVF